MMTQGAGAVPIRYLGSKARLAPLIAGRLGEEAGDTVVDLFAGMGHVTAGLAGGPRVQAQDVSPAAVAVLRWRLQTEHDVRPASLEVVEGLAEPVTQRLLRRLSIPLSLEREFFADPSPATALAVESAFGRPPGIGRTQGRGSTMAGYFGNAYFGLEQSIHLGAIRTALTSAHGRGDISASEFIWGVVALLGAASHVASTPGHFAQFFAITDENASAIAKLRSRSVMTQWRIEADRMRPAGTAHWRSTNSVFKRDSLSTRLPLGATVFADPPYTASQYSRFYHVLDTLALDDRPDCQFTGRYRSDRYKSPFCATSTVRDAFAQLISKATTGRRTLYVTYPSNGLLPVDALRRLARDVSAEAELLVSTPLEHAAPGRHQSQRRTVTEHLWRIHARSSKR
jgi:adenine-specific DNA-methyltransferase